MSQTVARRIPIGPVQVYLNDQRLGTSKSRAMLNWTYAMVYGRTGDNVGQINARKIDEEATIEVTISDLKASHIRYAMAQAKSLETISNILTSNYLATVTGTVWRSQQSKMGTGSNISTPFAFESGTVLVYSMDYETEYAITTDFLTSGANGTITHVSSGGINSGSYVNIHYKGYPPVAYIRGGGADDVQEGKLVLSGVDAAGKYFQFTAWRAKREGAFPIVVNQKDEYPGQTLTFRLMADVTNYSKGSQLFEISLEI